jgi:hypothetical protein
MNDQEIEFFIKSDLTWHKSTKTFWSSDNFFNILWNNALDDNLISFKSSNFRDFKKAKVSQQDKDAFEVMDLMKSKMGTNSIQIQRTCKKISS